MKIEYTEFCKHVVIFQMAIKHVEKNYYNYYLAIIILLLLLIQSGIMKNSKILGLFKQVCKRFPTFAYK